MTFMIRNGLGNYVDITPYIAFEGLKYSIQAVDGPNAGRTQDGTMVRDVVAHKVRWDVTCRPLYAEELAAILTLIKPDSFYVKYTDPETNAEATGVFYSNNVPAQYKLHRENGNDVWAGIAFPLVEI